MKILTLCTGNVARSAMLGYMLADLADAGAQAWHVRSAGTHVVEGLAMSSRTVEALRHLGTLGEHRYGAHRSHQIDAADVAWADVILAAELDNVDFVRHHFPATVRNCVQLGHFVAHAPSSEALSEQLRVVALVPPGRHLDVVDPAGADQAVYDACAAQLWELARAFATLVA